MVEDVVFVRLDDEEDAEGKHGAGFGGAVGRVSAGEAEGEGFNGSVCREGGGRDGRRVCGRVGVYGVEITMEWLEWSRVDLVKQTYARQRPWMTGRRKMMLWC